MTMLPPKLPPNAHTRAVSAISYVLVTAMIATVLWLRLLPATIAGFLAYALTRELEARLRRRHTLPQHARTIVVICVFIVAALILVVLGIGIGRLVEHGRGLEGMLTHITNVLDNLRESLPAAVASYVPQSVTELRIQLVQIIKEHGHQVSTLGTDGLRVSALTLVGLTLGAIIAWSETPDSEHHKSLATTLVSRLSRLTDVFEAAMLTQVEISTLNTASAAIYLLDTLPLFRQHVPYSESLILLTFVAGLTPVAGNLISNIAIVVMSVTASLELTVVSLIFLVVVRKLKYLVNARITGSRIDARTWELILALIVMEALFGVGGMIAMPVLYAYMKRKLADAGPIG